MRIELLTNEQMGRADRLAVEAGVSSLELMENAGSAVASQARVMVAPGSNIVVLCGPGNNGGDGCVSARQLNTAGFNVRLALSVSLDSLKGDALIMATRWNGEMHQFIPGVVEDADLIIDALFGAGLSRPLSDAWEGAQIIEAVNKSPAQVLAVDVPSGVNGSTGLVLGLAIVANGTVTFFRKKPGHLLYPGAGLCGETILADIGIPENVLNRIEGSSVGGVNTFINAPQLWLDKFPTAEPTTHKYKHGHAVAVSGPAHATGAARLAARGALRVGAGLVSVACPQEAVSINGAHLTTIMLAPFEGVGGLTEILEDRRKNAVIIGPGMGVGRQTRDKVAAVLKSGAGTVLDADALSSFEGRGEELVAAITALPLYKRPVVLTPHEGEFARLCPDVNKTEFGSKLDRARNCAKRFSSVVVLKGPDTVVAHPDGRASINNNAPPWLATAGSGDVLAGMIGGLLAQGMPAFEAASAAVWFHGACGQRLGRGLIAEDLPEALPGILQRLDENYL